LSYVVYLIGLVQWCTRQLAEVENMMTSVERIMTYAHLPSEQISLYMDPPRISKILSAHQIPKTVQKWNMPLAVAVAPTEQSISPFWPEHGNIIVQNLNLTLPTRSAPILNGITCSFEPKEKIAIVGRTGAGKSSFLSAFLRLVEPWPSGCITIDDVNISLLPLSELRRRISIIPQDPILFHGSIRFNLDPSRSNNSKEDEELWQVLDQVRLSKIIRELPDGLDSELNGSGTSIFSMGEKQLFCLARAILRKSRLIFMDEATANIDMATSDYIQTVIHKAFSDSNVFTIAHRLQTVIHYDRVMVLDQGKLVELDTPWNLVSSKEYTMPLEELALLDEDCDYWGLEDPIEEQSLFAKMIRELGPEEQKRMKKAAFDHYYSKQKIREDMVFDNASI
jgi:ATP-binding cassette subfamily C (CFTR/MRP) protein 4